MIAAKFVAVLNGQTACLKMTTIAWIMVDYPVQFECICICIQCVHADGGKCRRSASCLPSHFWPASSNSLSSARALTSCRISHATMAGNAPTLTTRSHMQPADEACTYALQDLACSYGTRGTDLGSHTPFIVHLLTCACGPCACQDKV